MKNPIRKITDAYLLPETVEVHTVEKYSVVNEAFLREYFPKCLYGLVP